MAETTAARTRSNAFYVTIALGLLSAWLALNLDIANRQLDRANQAIGIACQGWIRVDGHDSSDCPRALEILGGK